MIKNLITIDLLFWVASLALPKVDIDLADLLGLHFPDAADFKTCQIVSYMSIRDTHLFAYVFFNMFAVCMFGWVLENVWGPRRFLTFYFVTGIGTGLVREVIWFFNLRDVVFVSQGMINLSGAQIINKNEFLNCFVIIGASGAVLGILLVFAIVFPNVPLCSMSMPIPIKTKYFAIFYGLAELFMGMTSFGGDMVTHFAYLGGMLFGYFLIRYWRKKDADSGRYFY